MLPQIGEAMHNTDNNKGVEIWNFVDSLDNTGWQELSISKRKSSWFWVLQLDGDGMGPNN